MKKIFFVFTVCGIFLWGSAALAGSSKPYVVQPGDELGKIILKIIDKKLYDTDIVYRSDRYCKVEPRTLDEANEIHPGQKVFLVAYVVDFDRDDSLVERGWKSVSYSGVGEIVYMNGIPGSCGTQGAMSPSGDLDLFNLRGGINETFPGCSWSFGSAAGYDWPLPMDMEIRGVVYHGRKVLKIIRTHRYEE